TIYLSQAEVGLGVREPVSDAARTLSRYVDIIAARTFAHATVESLAKYAGVPVINALSDGEHPCQALADITTVYEKKGKLKGITVAYIGDGNNVASSLYLACALVGTNFRIASPQGYELPDRIVRQGRRFAQRSGADLRLLRQPEEAVKGADVVYTDVWTSMGQEAEAVKRRKAFAGYQVDARLMKLAKRDAIFMHDMPAHHGEEIASGMIDSRQSVVFDQAENKMHILKVLLAEILGRS
ncbi:MAG: ornithine carbamoyltransferase, partial [Chloroflexi bacterium]|nr:ornithine carbamoyltransferase [Chloroflexota bacterium]